LKCYFHGAGLDDGGNSQKSPGNGFFMLFYLMNGINSNYNTDLNKDNYNFYWEANRQNNGVFGEELYDFKLKYGTKAFDLNLNSFIKYQINAIILENNSIKLKSYNVEFQGYKTDPSNKNKCIIEKLGILTSELISTNEEYFTSSSESVSDSFKNGNDIIDIKTNKNTIIYNTLDNAFSSESSEFINDIVFSSQENNYIENKNEISQNVITSELILISEEYYTSSSEFIKVSIINEEYQTKNMTNINMINNTMNYIFSSELSFLNESSELTHNIELTTQENNLIENKTKIIQNIINNLITDFDFNYLINFTDRKKYYNNIMILLTSTHNQKINKEKNNINMNLGQCEEILKTYYNISQNDSLYILQIISEEEGMKIPKIEYEIYYPLNNKNHLIKLNLSL